MPAIRTSLANFRVELERQKIELLPPDIQKSEVYFSVEATDEENPPCVTHWRPVRNVGAAAMELLVQEREENGAFKDLFEFSERLDAQVMNKRQIENLARAGAFDAIVPNRRQVFEAVEMLTRHTHAMQNERESNQVNLFGDGFGDQARPRPYRMSMIGQLRKDCIKSTMRSVSIYPHIPWNPTGKPSIASVWPTGRMCRQGG